MPYWLLKTEPSTYSIADLERDGVTVWDGVANNQALIHIRNMRPGDQALIYHSGDERQVVGLATITSAPYADPLLADPKRAVVDIQFVRRVARPVPLSVVKADPAFAMFGLVRMSRLSVMPVSDELWQKLLLLAE